MVPHDDLKGFAVMIQHLSGDDPEPVERIPAALLLIPVRSGPAGDVLRLFRTPLGVRTAVGFTEQQRLADVLGPDHRYVELSEAALRALVDGLGVAELIVNPQLVAAPAATLRDPASWRGWEHSLHGASHLNAA
jgi:hypothetical protein